MSELSLIILGIFLGIPLAAMAFAIVGIAHTHWLPQLRLWRSSGRDARHALKRVMANSRIQHRRLPKP